MRPVYLSVCLLVTTVSPAKTAEGIEMQFGMWTRVGPRNRVLGGPGSQKSHVNLLTYLLDVRFIFI